MQNKSIREILNSYETTRDNAKKDLKKKQEHIYLIYPRIKEIDDEIKYSGLEMAKLALSKPENKNDLIDNLKEKINSLIKEKNNIFRS